MCVKTFAVDFISQFLQRIDMKFFISDKYKQIKKFTIEKFEDGSKDNGAQDIAR